MNNINNITKTQRVLISDKTNKSPIALLESVNEIPNSKELKERELNKIAKAQQRISELKLEEEAAEQQRIEKLKVDKIELLESYAHYSKKAEEQTDPKEEQKFRKWANSELALANAIEVNVENESEKVIMPVTPFRERALNWLFTHFGSWILQILLLLGAATFCYQKVIDQTAQIQKINSYLDSSGRVTEMIAPPLDLSDVQQIWFDKYRLISDMGFALFMLLVLAPHILLTLLPFIQLPKKLWVSFQQIPETQKQWLSFAWSALVLLVVIMSHQHK